MKKALPVIAVIAIIILFVLFILKMKVPSVDDREISPSPSLSQNNALDEKISEEIPIDRRLGDRKRKSAFNTNVIPPLHTLLPCQAFKLIDENLGAADILRAYQESLIAKIGETKSRELRNSLQMLITKTIPKGFVGETEVELFFEAAIKAGLYKTEKKDTEGSKKIFRKLQRMNAENGAYFYFNLPNISDKDELRDELANMVRAKTFDSHMNSLNRSMWEASLDDFSLFMGTINLFANVPAPNFIASRRVIRENLNLVDKKRLEEFSEMILKKSIRFKGHFIDIWWNPLEYAAFHGLHKRLDSKTSYPKAFELMNQADHMKVQNKRGEIMNTMKEDCSDELAESFMNEERLYYKEFKRLIAPQ